MTIGPFAHPEVFILGVRSMKMHFNIFPGQQNCRTLNIIGPLWSVLDSRVRSKLPPPSSLNQLDALHAEWYKIPLETIQNLSASIPRRLQTVLQANGDPTSY
jgi:hypothetical protein